MSVVRLPRVQVANIDRIALAPAPEDVNGLLLVGSSGTAPGGKVLLLDEHGAPVQAWRGRGEDARLGRAVGFLDDLNSDGVREIVAGDRGTLHIRSGRRDASVHSVPSAWSFAAVADLDGDGLRDLAVASPPRVVSAATGLSMFEIDLADQGCGKGSDWRYSVASAPDLDRDGVGDLLVGVATSAPRPDPFLRAALCSGRDGSLLAAVDTSDGGRSWRLTGVAAVELGGDLDPECLLLVAVQGEVRVLQWPDLDVREVIRRPSSDVELATGGDFDADGAEDVLLVWEDFTPGKPFAGSSLVQVRSLRERRVLYEARVPPSATACFVRPLAGRAESGLAIAWASRLVLVAAPSRAGGEGEP